MPSSLPSPDHHAFCNLLELSSCCCHVSLMSYIFPTGPYIVSYILWHSSTSLSLGTTFTSLYHYILSPGPNQATFLCHGFVMMLHHYANCLCVVLVCFLPSIYVIFSLFLYLDCILQWLCSTWTTRIYLLSHTSRPKNGILWLRHYRSSNADQNLMSVMVSNHILSWSGHEVNDHEW